MSDLGDLLELMHTGRSRPASVRLLLHEWANQWLWRQAAERYAQISLRTRIHGSFSSSADRETPLPEFQERAYRVWHLPESNNWRIETSLVGGELVKVLGASRAFTRFPDGTSSDDPREPVLPLSKSGTSMHGERFIEAMLNPAWLLGVASVVVTGRDSLRGRACLAGRLDFWPEVDLEIVDWPYADETRIWVDSEQGMILKMEMLYEGKLFFRLEAREVAFNEDYPEATFSAPF